VIFVQQIDERSLLAAGWLGRAVFEDDSPCFLTRFLRRVVVDEITAFIRNADRGGASGLLETARLAAARGSEPVMADSGEFILQVCPAPEDDAGELAETTRWLRAELLDLDIREASLLPDEDVPSGAKGVAAVAGWLLVELGPEALRAVLAKVADWVTRNGRVVEVSYGGDTLKLGRATREQQEKVIDGWLARHPAGS
jgi:hypothetical protein